MMINELENDTKSLKFYSQKAIGLATFFGGPLAAGYLIRENYISLNDRESGQRALIIGILFTIVMFVGIFMIPESMMDKLPGQVLPLIYTGVIYLIVEKLHGSILDKHKENNYEFFSQWKAVGVGLVSLVVLMGGIFGFAFLSDDFLSNEEYNSEMEAFYTNETETLVFYEHLGTESTFALIHELDSIVIPKWKENIEIIKRSNQIEDLSSETIQYNKTLLGYAKLRVDAFKLFRKAILEDTDQYDTDLELIHIDIEEQLNVLNAL